MHTGGTVKEFSLVPSANDDLLHSVTAIRILPILQGQNQRAHLIVAVATAIFGDGR